jgi:hypothetical protein
VGDAKPSQDLQKEIDSALRHIEGPMRLVLTDEEALAEVLKYEAEID